MGDQGRGKLVFCLDIRRIGNGSFGRGQSRNIGRATGMIEVGMVGFIARHQLTWRQAYIQLRLTVLAVVDVIFDSITKTQIGF